MKVSTPAIVLKTTLFKESSLIARLFTLEKGKSSYVIKSAMSQKSPLKAIYQQINEIEVNYTHNNKRQLQPIYDSKLLNGWNSINFDLKKISIIKNAEIPLLSDLLKASRNKFPLLLELKPIFSLKNLKKLLIETKKYNKCALISFEEKNIYNLGKLRTKLPKGLLFASTAKIKTIILKSKKSYINFVILHKVFLKNKELSKINKPVYFYPILSKKEFRKYKNTKNLIFENL